MSTQVSSLAGGVKRVIRGVYAGTSESNGIVTIPAINVDKSELKINTQIHYNSKANNIGNDGASGGFGSITGKIASSNSIVIKNEVEMWIGYASPIVEYAQIDWELTEYV